MVDCFFSLKFNIFALFEVPLSKSQIWLKISIFKPLSTEYGEQICLQNTAFDFFSRWNSKAIKKSKEIVKFYNFS